MTTLTETLKKTSVLQDLTPPQLQALGECAETVKYKSNEFLFQRGREADRFFLIIGGKVNLELYTPEHGPKSIQTLGPGNLLGTSWIASSRKWKLDARAATDTEVVSFKAESVQEKCEKDPSLGYHLLKSFFIAISQRLDATQAQILEQFSKNN